MKPLHHKKHTPAKRFLSLLCVLALCLGLLPVTALAVDAPATLYVGNQQVISGTETTYWSTNNSGELTQSAENNAWNVKYDPNTVTLTLKNATIEGVYNNVNTSGSGIYAASSSGPVSLNIVLEEENKVSGMYGINVSSSGGDASLNISGSGSLTVSGLSGNGIGIFMSSQNSANLTIEEASVTALGSQDGGSGVRLITSQTGSPSLTIEVKGGSLQASGETNGIHFLSNVNGATAVANLKVSGNAMVKASNIITTKDGTGSAPELKPAASGSDGTGGIIWDGKSGTVYGNVTLQEDITIGEGESLTIPDDASLTVPDGKTLTNNGTVTTEGGGTLTNNGKIDNSGTLPDNIQGSAPPKITTASLTNGEVDKNYSEPLASDNNPTKWSVTSGSLPGGLTLNESTGEISGTPTNADAYTFTVKAENNAGSDSKAFILTVTQPVTSVTLDKNTLELYTGGSENLTATVAPDNATNKTVTWSSSDNTVATVDTNGNVTAVKEGTAAITATAADGSGCSATCTVTVTDKTYTISADPTALNFGSAYTGYAQPAAQTVTLTNTGNQPVTLTQPASTNSFEVGTLSTTNLAVGETATFTVQPKAGLSAGTYSDTIAVTGNGGVTSSIIASFTVKSQPSYNPPTVSEKTIDAIQDAQPGETVTVDLSHGSTKLDQEVFETLAGQDITLVIDLGDGLSWTVNGTDIPEDADFVDIDLGVTMDSDGIPVDLINAITGEHGSVQMTLAHDGAFGFTMTLTAPLGAENAGYWANLYHFNEDTNAMTFETAAPIGDDGSVSLSLSHASQYVLVIDDHNHGVVTLPFTDVADSDWFYDPVCDVYSQGLMTGTSATTFEPNTHLSRAMLVAVLHRLEGSPAASAGDFTDVADGDWYAQAVNWAASVGVVNGFDDGTFQPNAAISREQLAAILRNYAQYKGLDVTATGDLSAYTDANSVSDWAKESVTWAVGEHLISGITDDTLAPQACATRAQVAAILQRFLSE